MERILSILEKICSITKVLFKSKSRNNSTIWPYVCYNSIIETPIRLVPLFASTPEPRMMPSMTNNDLTSNYANGAATIGLRISGNLHGKHMCQYSYH